MFGRAEQELEVGRIEVIDLKPGDTLFFQTPHRVSREAFHRLRDQLRDQVPSGVKVIVLECGMTVAAVRPEEDS